MTRRDGQPVNPNARYLVLDYSGRDPHALIAIKAYAASVQTDNPQMADDLRDAIKNPTNYPAQHD